MTGRTILASLDGRLHLIGSGLLLLALALLPLALPSQWIGTLSGLLVMALFTLSFGLLVGQGGMLSFGHSAYFAIGCFATLHLMRAAEAGNGFPTPLMPLAGAAAGLAAGAAAGFFATRRRGVYFSMVTLAIAELLHTLAPNLQALFGGESGLSSMRMPWAGLSFGSETEVYYLVLVWVALCAIAMFLYTGTGFGRVTVALRENERRLSFMGFDVHQSKMLVFAVSGLFAGAAGGLLALANESANYSLFGLDNSAKVVLYAYIGGIGNFFGPAIGAAVMTLFGHAASELTRQWLLYQGLIFVLMMMYAPQGLTGLVQQQIRRFIEADAGERLRRVAALALMLVIGATGVFFCELASLAFAPPRSGAAPASLSLFGRAWQAGAAGSWLAPLLLGLGAVLLLRRLLVSPPQATSEELDAEAASALVSETP